MCFPIPTFYSPYLFLCVSTYMQQVVWFLVRGVTRYICLPILPTPRYGSIVWMCKRPEEVSWMCFLSIGKSIGLDEVVAGFEVVLEERRYTIDVHWISSEAKILQRPLALQAVRKPHTTHILASKQLPTTNIHLEEYIQPQTTCVSMADLEFICQYLLSLSLMSFLQW